MECVFCRQSGNDNPETAIVLQSGYLFPARLPEREIERGSWYPVCKEHKAEIPDERNEKVVYTIPIIIGEGSPAGDLHMVLDFIREYFRDKPLPGLEGAKCHIDISELEDERLAVLIRHVRPLLVLRRELEEFVVSNELE